MTFNSPAIAVIALSSVVATSVAAHENEAEHRLEDIVSYFAEGAVVGDPSIVDCTLNDGTQTSCFAITVTGEPESHTTGPWCPTNISQAGVDAGGIWLENDQVYEVDGPLSSGWPNSTTTRNFSCSIRKPVKSA